MISNSTATLHCEPVWKPVLKNRWFEASQINLVSYSCVKFYMRVCFAMASVLFCHSKCLDELNLFLFRTNVFRRYLYSNIFTWAQKSQRHSVASTHLLSENQCIYSVSSSHYLMWSCRSLTDGRWKMPYSSRHISLFKGFLGISILTNTNHRSQL